MARKLTFRTSKTSEELEPIEIEIGPEGKEEVFHAAPMILGIDLLNLLSGIESDSAAEASKAVRKLFEIALGTDDEHEGAAPADAGEHKDSEHERFLKFISDKNNFVDAEILMDVALSLAEEYMGGVPTTPEQNSSNGSAPSGSGSKAGSSRRKAPVSKA
jgi:hypothetical protein